MNNNSRILTYARQLNIPTKGASKNASTMRKLVAKLTPRQQRRIRSKIVSG